MNAFQLYGMNVGPDTEWETVIGLEVHVQLATESKIFSQARARLSAGGSVADEMPNANTTPVCAGHPGTLPSLNQKAVEYAVRTGLATQCRINLKSQFARKHYFYPDLPKGYQISQLELPLCEAGHLNIEVGAEGSVMRRIGITRIHMEEDAGKNLHRDGFSLVNLNRAGVPLVEVVSEPDLRTAEEAGAYLRKLYGIVTCIGVCDGNLQEGNFRCDANVSVRPKGCTRFGTRTEIKNVNSFRFVEKAIEVEAERQKQVILMGGEIHQETRLYDAQKNQTFSMRSKEEAQDYRYFPDPDLPPLLLGQDWVDGIRRSLPELPDQKRDRYRAEFGLSKYDSSLLSSSGELARFFEAAAIKVDYAKPVSNLLVGEVTRLLNDSGLELAQTKLVPKQFSDLAALILEQAVSVTAAKQVVGVLFKDGGDVPTLVERLGLKQLNDLRSIEPLIEQLIAANPKQVAEYRSGKEKVLGFFVGQVMKATGGKVNPGSLQELMIKKLKE